MKDLFDEIDEERKELPRLKKISKEVQKNEIIIFINSWQFVYLYFYLLLV